MLADLYLGYEAFLRFAVEASNEEAITRAEVQDELARSRAALLVFGRAQLAHQSGADPAERYFERLRSALFAGKAHVAGPDGQRPANAEAWGWRVDTEQMSRTWRPLGDRIGWVDGDDLFLQPAAAYRVAQAQVADGDAIPVSERMLARHLHEKKFIVTAERESQGTFTARKKLEGSQRRVLHVHSLRHSLATMLAASGVPMPVAQRIMRHRDIKLTAEVYTDEGLLPLHAAMQALPRLSGCAIGGAAKLATQA